jgi:subtilisin family serine protease
MWHPPFNPFFLQSGFGEKSVHLAAPGVSVITTTAHGDCFTCSPSDNPNDWYVTVNGTSLSAALVSGVAALVMTKYPADNVFVIKRRILAGVQPVPALLGDNFLGRQLVITGGRLDAAGALAATVGVSSPSVTSARYKKGNQKLILTGEDIQRDVRIFVAGKGYDAKSKGGELKLVVPRDEIPVGVAVTITLRNPDGGESPPFIFTR